MNKPLCKRLMVCADCMDKIYGIPKHILNNVMNSLKTFSVKEELIKFHNTKCEYCNQTTTTVKIYPREIDEVHAIHRATNLRR